jgi:hypothetical protein
MNRETFWELTSRVDRGALHAGDEDAAVEPLVAALAEYVPREIRAYEDHLSEVLHGLDGKVFADHAGENGDSGDAFLYCRCYVVANGKDHYSGVLSDPTGMPRSLDEWCETLLFVAARAWGRRTRRNPDEWDHETAVSWETGSNRSLWPARATEDRDPFYEPVLTRAIARAGHEYAAGQHANVVSLLAPHEKQLSSRMWKTLRDSRAKLDVRSEN